MDGQFSAEILLEARHLTRIFARRSIPFARGVPKMAVDDVSLKVRHGETYAIVGESGSGKTTLSRMLLGLIQPSAGEILLRGRPIGHYTRAEFTRSVQAIFQNPLSSLNPRKTVSSIISLPLRVHARLAPADRNQRVLEIMDQVGLPPRLGDAYPAQISGGQRQRVAIARALILRPEIVICDEPTSALDASVQAQVLNLLMDLQAGHNITLLIITHNLSIVRHMANRVAVMTSGRIVEEGTTEQIFAHPSDPYTRMLMDTLLIPEFD